MESASCPSILSNGRTMSECKNCRQTTGLVIDISDQTRIFLPSWTFVFSRYPSHALFFLFVFLFNFYSVEASLLLSFPRSLTRGPSISASRNLPAQSP